MLKIWSPLIALRPIKIKLHFVFLVPAAVSTANKAKWAQQEADIWAESVPLARIRSEASYENGNKVLTFSSAGFCCSILN